MQEGVGERRVEGEGRRGDIRRYTVTSSKHSANPGPYNYSVATPVTCTTTGFRGRAILSSGMTNKLMNWDHTLRPDSTHSANSVKIVRRSRAKREVKGGALILHPLQEP